MIYTIEWTYQNLTGLDLKANRCELKYYSIITDPTGLVKSGEKGFLSVHPETTAFNTQSFKAAYESPAGEFILTVSYDKKRSGSPLTTISAPDAFTDTATYDLGSVLKVTSTLARRDQSA